MIHIKYRLNVKKYELTNYSKGLFIPFVIVGFSENVTAKENKPTSNRTFVIDRSTYELQGLVKKEEADVASLLLYIFHPQTNGDEPQTYVYQRVSQLRIDYCSELRVKTYYITVHNKTHEKIAEVEFEVLEIKCENIKSTSLTKRKLIESNPSQLQSVYEDKISQFIKSNFNNIWEGTKKMTLFNDDFGFNGKVPFYQFINFELKKTNTLYWKKLFSKALLLKYTSESRSQTDIKTFWKTLPLSGKLSILVDMITLPSTASYYLPDFVQRIKNKGNKINMKYIEDFNPIYQSWVGDCEDLAQFALVMLTMFQSCEISFQETELVFLQKISQYYILHLALSCADKAAAGSKQVNLSAHMCGILLKKGFIRDKTRFNNVEDKAAFDKIFENYVEPSVILNEFTKTLEPLPNVLIAEGTGYVEGCLSDTYHERADVKQYQLQESIKDRIFMSKEKIPFYLYVFEVLTNFYIDQRTPLNIQSFILTYNKDSNTTVNKQFDDKSRIYGIKIKDLFENSDNIELIATPTLDFESLELTKRLSKSKLGIPPCFVENKTHQNDKKVDELLLSSTEDDVYASSYAIDNVSPIAPSVYLKRLTESKVYKKLFLTSQKINTPRDFDIYYLMVPPRNFEIAYQSLIDEGGVIFGIQIFQYFSDLTSVIIWLKK